MLNEKINFPQTTWKGGTEIELVLGRNCVNLGFLYEKNGLGYLLLFTIRGNFCINLSASV